MDSNRGTGSLRILQIHNRYNETGGEDQVVENEADILRRAGHDIVLFEERNPAGGPRAVARLALSSWNGFSAARVRQVVRTLRPDVVHVHNLWYSLTPAVLAAVREEGVPLVLTMHNYRVRCSNALLFRDGEPCRLCIDGSAWQGVRYRCYRNSTTASIAAASSITIHSRRDTWNKDIDRLVVLTEFARSVALESGVLPARVVLKPNFVPDPGHRNVRASSSNTVLFVGRLSHEKGIEMLLKAWEKTASPRLQLRLVGDGPLASKIDSRPGVSLAGFLPKDETLKLMRESRALVVPSLCYEVQPLVILEALAAGLPVIASAVGALPATVGRAGDVGFPLPTVDAWAGALSLLSDDRWIDLESERGRVWYEQEYSPTVGLANLENLYGSVIDEKRIPGSVSPD